MTAPYFTDDQVTLWHGNALDVARELPDGSVDSICSSPPYFGLRDYGVPGTDWPAVEYAPMADMPTPTVPAMTCPLGLEPSPAAYVAHLVLLFRELRRVLADDGTMWINLGDSFSSNGSSGAQGKTGQRADSAFTAAGMGAVSSLPAKNLLGIPWRTAFALQADGWILRNSIVWYAPNKMPESVTDRLSTKHEMVFMFSKQRSYWFDLDAIREAAGDYSGRSWADRKASGGKSDNRGIGTNGSVVDTVFAANPNGRNPGDYWEFDDEPIELPAKRLGEDEAAYMAAFIDGEGSICIRRRKRQIQLILCVVNTHEGIIRWLHERTGMGQIGKREIRNEKWRQVWEWNCSSRQAAQVIYAIYPYLRVKRQQAAVALHFMETTRKAGGGAASAAYHERRHRMAEDLSALNAGTITESKFAVDPAPPLRSSAGDVFVVNTQPFAAAHFAVMPRALAERCIQAGCKPGGTVLDPFSGSGTTGLAAARHGRRYVGIDLSKEYLDLSLTHRLQNATLDFTEGTA